MYSGDLENLFYESLCFLRSQKGVSARDMSISLGQNENYINNIENRKNFPSLKGLFYICEYLNIHPKDFFNDELENPELASEMFKKIQSLSSKEMEHLLLIIDDLLTKSTNDRGRK